MWKGSVYKVKYFWNRWTWNMYNLRKLNFLILFSPQHFLKICFFQTVFFLVYCIVFSARGLHLELTGSFIQSYTAAPTLTVIFNYSIYNIYTMKDIEYTTHTHCTIYTINSNVLTIHHTVYTINYKVHTKQGHTWYLSFYVHR